MIYAGIDIETTGQRSGYALQPRRVLTGEARITSISIIDENQKVYAAELEPKKGRIYQIFNDCKSGWSRDDVLLTAWNLPFEQAWFLAYGIDVRLFRWHDAKIAYRAAHNDTYTYNWGLKQAVARYFPDYANYEAGIDFDDPNAPIDQNLLEYNCKDSYFTALLARMLDDKLTSREKVAVKIMVDACSYFAQSWIDGIEINMDGLFSLAKRLSNEATENAQMIGLTPDVLRSPAKLKSLLQTLGVPVDGASKGDLYPYLSNSLVHHIDKARKAMTGISKVVEGIGDAIEYNGCERIYPGPRIFATYTGRNSYESKVREATGKKNNQGGWVRKEKHVSLALHQMPRGKHYRDTIQAPDGWLLGEFDFQGQESRLLADYSQDQTLLRVFNDGLDIHSVTGSQCGDVTYSELVARVAAHERGETVDDEAKRIRMMGKVANLSLGYRTSAATLQEVSGQQYGLPLTMEEAQRIHFLFRKMYPGVVSYWARAIDFAKRNKYAESRSGRRVYLDDWSQRHGWASQQTAINFPIQSTGADMKLLAIVCVGYRMGNTGEISYSFDLHDASYYLIKDNSRAVENAKTIQSIMSNLPYFEVYGWRPSVPLPAGCKLGKTWGKLVELA